MILTGLAIILAAILIREWIREHKQRKIDDDFRRFLTRTYAQSSQRPEDR